MPKYQHVWVSTDVHLSMIFGSAQLYFSKVSGEVSDLKLSESVKVIFIFNAKLVC